MGTSKFGDDSVDIDFVGREEEFEKVRLLLNKQNAIGIYGVTKIGKSKFLAELSRRMSDPDTLSIFKDFATDDITSSYLLNKWFREIFTLTDMHSRLTDFIFKFPEENLSCGLCNKCLYNEMCEHRREYLEQAMFYLIETLQCCSKGIVLFLDNVDKLLESDLKDSFFRFIDHINEKCSNVNLIFCSRIKITNVKDSFESISLGPMDWMSILKIIYLSTEDANESSSESIQDEEQKKVTCCSEQDPTAHLFKKENEYFTPENRESMEEIARLCDGYPLVAVMSGNLLVEDNGLLTPAELMDILKEMKSKVHSPDYELSTGIIGDCESPMQQLELIFSEIQHDEAKRKENATS